MNNYKDLALYDLKAAEKLNEYEMWNKVGRECQQSCEKYLKFYLQSNNLLSTELEKTNNLKKPMRAVPNHDKHLLKELAVVGGYYFEANYPGDNFIELNQEMADEAIETTTALIKFIDSLH